MTSKPKKTPRCNCGQVTEWCWDPYDERWYISKCWLCLEIQWMKDPTNGILKSLLPWDTNMINRFIELAIDDTIMSETVMVKRYKGRGVK